MRLVSGVTLNDDDPRLLLCLALHEVRQAAHASPDALSYGVFFCCYRNADLKCRYHSCRKTHHRINAQKHAWQDRHPKHFLTRGALEHIRQGTRNFVCPFVVSKLAVQKILERPRVVSKQKVARLIR